MVTAHRHRSRVLSGKLRAVSLLLAILFAQNTFAFQLQDLQAERVHLSDFVIKGKWNLVMFWSTDCIPCEQQKPMIEAFHVAHRETDAVVLGVALDGMENRAEIDMLIKKHNPSYPNLVVFTDVFARQFRELTGQDFRATPTYLLFTPEGEIAGVRAGPIDRELIEAVVAADAPRQ